MSKPRLLLSIATILLAGNGLAAAHLSGSGGAYQQCYFRPSIYHDHCIEVCEWWPGGCGGECEQAAPGC